MAYSRDDPPFAYLDLRGAQLMLEQDHHDSWTTGDSTGPRGRGMNLQIEVPDVRAAVRRLTDQGVSAFRELTTTTYDTAEGPLTQSELLAEDPDGYLIRLVQRITG